MTIPLVDQDGDLLSLVEALTNIAKLLESFRATGADETPHREASESPYPEVKKVTMAFVNIESELKDSHGVHVHQRYGAIARNLRAAADALHKE